MDLGLWNSIALWIIASFFLILTLLLLFVGVPVALDVKKTVRKMRGTIDEVRIKVDPILFSAQQVADDVQEMTATAKREAERMGDSVDRVSERIDEFAAIVEVVQEEIQKPLLKSVATISGARRALNRWL
ncbi:MAG: hypothetical protein R3326_03980 [Gemmatimonadota bacterium]|nr:hypothetical protein [Gemmatimonadota bacterium]